MRLRYLLLLLGAWGIIIFYPLSSSASFQPSDIRLDTGDPPGASNSYPVKLCNTSDGHVYTVWQDYRESETHIFFNYSPDQGTTWQTPDVKIDGNAPGSGTHSFNPNISCTENGHVYIIWDENNFIDYYDIESAYSSDYGQTWTTSSPNVFFFIYTPDPLYPHISSIEEDRKSTRLNSSHIPLSRMPSSA